MFSIYLYHEIIFFLIQTNPGNMKNGTNLFNTFNGGSQNILTDQLLINNVW